MYFDPKLLKNFLILIFIVAGAFLGYQFFTPDDFADVSYEAEENQLPAQSGEAEYELIDGEPFVADRDTGLEVSAEPSVDLTNLVDDQYGNEIQFNNTFVHTKPGEYSEIVVETSGLEPGEFSIMYVRKAGTEEYIAAGGQEHTVDSDGKISTRFIITEFGNYEVMFSYKGESVVSPTIVVN